MFNDKFLVFISIFLLISCARESNTNRVTLHPVQEKMPYANVEPEILQVQDGGEVIDIFPESVQLLYYVLNDERDALLLNTDPILLASGVNDTLLTTGNIDVSSVSDSSLLILERNTNRLIQYNIDEQKYHVIANQGRGPGDLHFSRELSVFENKAFVAMQGFQISKFTCNNGLCEYAKTIQTDYNNYSVAPQNESIYFLGVSAFGREGDPDPSNTDQYLIHKINDYGVQQSFLPIYRDRSPLVRDAMNSGGRVRLFPESDSIVVTFSRVPYLYVHDFEGRLTAKYELPEYLQRYFESEEDRVGRISTHYSYDGNYSSISYTSKINDGWLLLRMREDRDKEYHANENRIIGTVWYSYYAFDVAEKKIYRIGEDLKKPVSEERRVLHVVDQGVIINEDGLLYLLLNMNKIES